MKRKPGTLLSLETTILETTILETALGLRRSGEEEFHGFAIAKEIAEDGEARTLTADGALYEARIWMQAAGLLGSRWEDPAVAAEEGRPRRRLYHVAGLGGQALSASNATPPSPPIQVRRGVAAS